MPIQKGPLSFTLFRTDREAPPPPEPEAFAERLRSLSFREAVSRSEEKTIGWTGLEDVLDRDFRRYPPVRGNLALFSLRIDRKQVSPALLRFRTLEAQRRLKEESRQERLSRHQQGLLRETIREELLSTAPAVPALFEACWFLPEGRVLFGTHTDGICDDFTLLFRDTFSTVLAPWSPWEEAAAALGPEGPAPFVLGREFLTWLWFKSEERDGAVALDKKEEVELEFIRRIVLEGGEGSHAETVVCHGLNAELKEGREALRRGKKIREARLALRQDADSWEFTFKADRFRFQSMKLPADAEEDAGQKDEEGRLLERIHLAQRAVSIVERLFALFFAIRRTPAWAAEEIPRMARWLERG